MSKFLKKVFSLLCGVSICCVSFASEFGAWHGIQELDQKIHRQVIDTCKSLLVTHGSLGDSGKSRNVPHSSSKCNTIEIFVKNFERS